MWPAGATRASSSLQLPLTCAWSWRHSTRLSTSSALTCLPGMLGQQLVGSERFLLRNCAALLGRHIVPACMPQLPVSHERCLQSPCCHKLPRAACASTEPQVDAAGAAGAHSCCALLPPCLGKRTVLQGLRVLRIGCSSHVVGDACNPGLAMWSVLFMLCTAKR